jgi:hypothetical protein
MTRCFPRSTRVRHGNVGVETIVVLGISFPAAMVLFWMAFRSFANLYQVISSIVGSPYM